MFAQLAAVELVRALQQAVVVFFTGVRTETGSSLVWHVQAHRACQFLYGLGKFQIFVIHQKADGAAVGAAAETVVELLVRADGKGRGFFVVERAAGLVFTAGLFQAEA